MRPKLHLIRRFCILSGLITGALILTGCPVVVPPTPPQATGPEETPFSFIHRTQIIWDFPELNQLKSLSIRHPAQIKLLQSSDRDELSVQLEFDVEKPHHDVYANEYLQLVMAQSNLQGENEKLVVPVPSHTCKETFDAEGRQIGLEGICIHAMTIVLPSLTPSTQDAGSVFQLAPLSIEAAGGFNALNISLPFLALSVDDGSHSEINQFTGNLKVTDGGTQATLKITGLTGDLDLELGTIQRVELENIVGHVHIAVTQPLSDPNAVSLDGKSITSFPFDRR